MKSYSSLIFLLLLSIDLPYLQAQSTFVVEPDEFNETLLGQDLSLLLFAYEFDSFISNTSTTDTLFVKWTRIISDNCNPNWLNFIADENLEYLPTISCSPNYIELLPGETTSLFRANVLPQMEAGCCEFEVIFSDYHNPSNIFDTISYGFQINEETCLTTSTNKVQQKDNRIILSPNPAYQIINIIAERKYDKVLIFDASGRSISDFQQSSPNQINIEMLASGIYTLILYTNNQKIGVSKFVKMSKI